MIKKHALWLVLSLSAIIYGGTTSADGGKLPSPTGEVILTVAGNIQRHTQDTEGAQFDMEALKRLGEKTLRTSTPWTKGITEFRGVSLSDLLAHVGASGQQVRASALNEYHADIPQSDYDKYDILLAYEQNGRKLTRRDKGPLWIIYPVDQNPELNTQEIFGRWVWQLERLTVQ